MKEIKLTQGKIALVDDKDFEYLNQFKWCAKRDGERFYSMRQIRINGRQRSHFMHRVILGDKCKGFEIDHIDGNGLNNQKSNLRVCTKSQNQRNKLAHRNCRSQYKGVQWLSNRSRWISRITIDGKQKSIFYGKSEIEAAKAYDRKAKEIFGEFARVNFPENFVGERVMNENIMRATRIAKVREMKYPTILMHSDDFKSLKTEVESMIKNFKVSENPKFEGIPIKISDIIEKGTFLIYDAIPL